MNALPLLVLALAVSPALAHGRPDEDFLDAVAGASEVEVEAKKNPCLAENIFLNHYEVLFEAAPLYAPAGKVAGAPPRSVVLTMDRCEVYDRDHVEGYPLTPRAERWYTDGDWGLILTTELGSLETAITVVTKRHGSWTTAGQMGKFVTVELFDVWNRGRAAAKLDHGAPGGVALPYALHASIRPSWNR